MSTHKVEVVALEAIEPHPNADRMEITRVYGYFCCVGKGQFKPGALAAYIEPDSLVDPAVPEFAFLASKADPAKYGGKVRIKVSKLRGVVSQGLVVPARPHWKRGDDVMAELGVVHYDPPVSLSTAGESAPAPAGHRPSYDVESFYRWPAFFRSGEPVVATEKVHGASGRFAWVDGRLHCGSRTEWKREDDRVVWWQAAKASPWLVEFCRAHPELTVYGEVFGRVQDLRYGLDGVAVIVFDLLRGNEWISHREAREVGRGLDWVPVVYEGPWDEAKLRAMADGASLIPSAKGQIRLRRPEGRKEAVVPPKPEEEPRALGRLRRDQALRRRKRRRRRIREGIVVKPLVERTVPEIGRVQLKLVSNAYLERA